MENNLNKNLEDYLNFYKSLTNPQFAVMINGSWGSGKTYYIKKKLKLWADEAKASKKNQFSKKIRFWQKEDEARNEGIVLRPVYVSLYGISTTSQINEKIREALNPLLYGKGAKVLKKIMLGTVKTATHINLDTNSDNINDGKVTFDINSLGLLKDKDEKIKGEKLLIFDDVERCKIRITELFGYVNEFVEHYGCKVILLNDETKTIEKAKIEEEAYNEFKEKLIGQTFAIQPDIDSAIISFIYTLSESEVKTFLKDSAEMIKAVFNASAVSNLRILRQAVLDFERFANQFDQDIKGNKKYNGYLKNLLFHFVLVYLEYKSGNVTVAEISKFKFTEQQKENEGKIRLKYNETLTKYNIVNRIYIIGYDVIEDFIKNGFNKIEILNSTVKTSQFFNERELKHWEKMWNWENLDEDEFDNLYKEVVDYIKNKEVENPYELLHAIMTMISLKRNGIIKTIEFEPVPIFKENFERILENNTNLSYFKFSDHSWSKSYREKDSIEFKEITEYANERIAIHNQENKDNYLVQVFEELNNENIRDLQDKLDSPLPDRSSNYSSGPILEYIDAAKLAEKLLSLNRDSLDAFFIFVEKRYFPERIFTNGNLLQYNTIDKDAIIKIKDRFKAEIKVTSRIRKFNLKRYVSLLEDLIKKLEEMEKRVFG